MLWTKIVRKALGAPDPNHPKEVEHKKEEYHFTNSNSFRGFKRYTLTVYKTHHQIDKLKELNPKYDPENKFKEAKWIVDLKNAPIKITRVYHEEYTWYDVFAKGMKVGTIYDSSPLHERVKDISELCVRVFQNPADENSLLGYIYVKFKEEECDAEINDDPEG